MTFQWSKEKLTRILLLKYEEIGYQEFQFLTQRSLLERHATRAPLLRWQHFATSHYDRLQSRSLNGVHHGMEQKSEIGIPTSVALTNQFDLAKVKANTTTLYLCSRKSFRVIASLDLRKKSSTFIHSAKGHTTTIYTYIFSRLKLLQCLLKLSALIRVSSFIVLQFSLLNVGESYFVHICWSVLR